MHRHKDINIRGLGQLLAIGSNITRIRRKKGWTQAKLARMTSLSMGYIAAIEQGRGHPSINALAIIAEALGVEIGDLKEDK